MYNVSFRIHADDARPVTDNRRYRTFEGALCSVKAKIVFADVSVYDDEREMVIGRDDLIARLKKNPDPAPEALLESPANFVRRPQ